MEICLINPGSPWLKRQNAFPPLGLLYLASFVRGHGYKPIVHDLGAKDSMFLNKYYDLYGITSTTPQYEEALSIKSILRRNDPKAKIVLGGPHATYTMNGNSDGFDFVFKGDGEFSLNSYIKKPIPFIDSNFVNQPMDLDVIPLPARDLINLSDYKYFIGKDNLPATTIITSRGCPYSCAFCAKTDNNVRFHSAEYVCQEIDEIKDKYNFDNLLFLDDCFSLKEERLLKILAHTKKRDIKFRCYIRSDTKKSILDKLKESGCVEVGMGIESGSQEILNVVSKKTTVEQNTDTVKYCESIGLPVNAFLMIGLPGETKQTSEETITWVRNAKPTKFGYNIFVPYPGSDIFRNRADYDILIHDMPNEKAVTKGDPDSIESFVSTSSLSNTEISDLFHKNFNDLVEITGWNPACGEFIK